MLLVLSVRLAATIHYYLQAFAPTNILLRHLRTGGGLKWAIPAALLIVPTYLFAAAITTTVIADGGPGWLNLRFYRWQSLVGVDPMWTSCGLFAD